MGAKLGFIYETRVKFDMLHDNVSQFGSSLNIMELYIYLLEFYSTRVPSDFLSRHALVM